MKHYWKTQNETDEINLFHSLHRQSPPKDQGETPDQKKARIQKALKWLRETQEKYYETKTNEQT